MDENLTIPLPDGIPLELVLVPAGHFIMGSEAKEAYGDEGPEHIVHISRAFYIGKYPVTQAQWEAVMGDNPSEFTGPQRPVERVSWNDIVEGNQDDGEPAFLNRLNRLLPTLRPELANNHVFRLPTEAEWEYAAKGGPRFTEADLAGKNAAELYPIYSGSDRLESCGWFSGNSNGETKPVGLKQANELGLYDMSGNVDEWCRDGLEDYNDRKNPVTKDPVGPTGVLRVLRGGRSWGSARLCRSTCRLGDRPAHRNDDFGFRLVLSPSSGPGTSG